MKNQILFLALLLFCAINLNAQLDGFGVFFGSNFSSQDFKRTGQSENHFINSNNLQGLNIGIYGVKKMGRKWEWRPSLSIQQQGRTENAFSSQVSIFTSDSAINKLENKLSYLTFSMYLDHIFNPNSNALKVAVFAGLDNNFIVNERISEGELVETFSFFPRSEYEGRWNSYYLGYSFGFRFRIFDMVGISTFVSNNLSAVLKTENLKVNNYSFGISVDTNLTNLIN